MRETVPAKEGRLQQRRAWVKRLMETSEPAEMQIDEPQLGETEMVFKNYLAQLQLKYSTLADCFKQVKEKEGVAALLDKKCVLKNLLLVAHLLMLCLYHYLLLMHLLIELELIL